MASSYQVLGNGYIWARGDPLPQLPPLDRFRATPATGNRTLLAHLAGLVVEEVNRRIEASNRPYLAWLGDVPVGYGWSTSGNPSNTGSPMRLALPPGYRYLWDFATLSDWRGRGIYPHLLQAIFALEADATHFTIGHDASNIASRKGILRAGFRHTMNVVLLPSGGPRLVTVDGSPLPIGVEL